MQSSSILIRLAIALLALAFMGNAFAREFFVYFGTYTGAKSKGIYVSRLDTKTGTLTTPELVAETTNPSFLAVHPKGELLYAVNEISKFQDKASGAVSSFALDRRTGKLTPLNQQSSVGPGPCHLVVDKSGRTMLVANYGGGSVAALPIGDDGRLGEASSFFQHVRAGTNTGTAKPKPPRGHSINVSPDNRFAAAADLGLDQILVYRLEPARGELMPNDPPFASVAPGSGPRHFAFHPSAKFAYVINETTCTMTAFAYDAKRGVLTEIQTLSTLPPGESVKPGYSTAEVQVHPNGRFLYGSNRGHDTIAVFAIDWKSGRLTLVENVPTQGKIPRNFGIDPSGEFFLAANQNSDNVVVFRIDKKTGRLTPTGQVLDLGAPVCVKFVPVK